ncbi:MAG: AMP-dependent synthetase/ligase [Gemmatimonadetes bacterium]|nr:AMP-dependent synthetase/ligase [Gemmatimonadota bacterium]
MTLSAAQVDEAGATPLVHRFFARAAATPEALAFAVYPPASSRATAQVTWGMWAQQVRGCAARLLRDGVMPGDRIAVLAGNRLMWPVLDVALQAVRAIGVGIFPGSTADQVDALLADCGARMLFTDDRAEAARLAGRLEVVVLDAPESVRSIGVEPWSCWCEDAGRALAQDVSLTAALEARIASVTPDDLFAIVYTSGSTGAPKGACLSHRYLAASAASIVGVLGFDADDRGLSFLPYSHAAERVFGQGVRLLVGGSAALVARPADLFLVSADFRPTSLPGLPRIFERLDEAIAADVARGVPAQDALRAQTGGQLRRATSGGATLPTVVAERLAALELTILGAYGQSEHLCIAMNRPEAPRFDCVGVPMPGTTVAIADDGELLVRRSALTFSGYWGRDAETRAAFSADGLWLHTGDLAEQDADGALRITGRAKELIALSTGRKVAPAPIEQALVATPHIAQALVHGEGQKFLTALLVPRRDALERWARANGVEAAWPALLADDAVRALLQAAVDAVNATLARTDRIGAFATIDEEFTVEAGLLTPTLKVVRRAVAARHAARLAALYASREVR